MHVNIESMGSLVGQYCRENLDTHNNSLSDHYKFKWFVCLLASCSQNLFKFFVAFEIAKVAAAAEQPRTSVEGFCTNMCPDYQLRSRTQHANENSLEVIDPLGRGRGIDQLATKKFERNVSDLVMALVLCSWQVMRLDQVAQRQMNGDYTYPVRP